ncbi:MAG: photosystem II reaction center protein PsbM [Oscillatoriales cyanobacterium CG2_30_44_21]|jgi:photosystem II PsbM protein|uniref:Photosystem II reaction center protein M n=1 Tax=Pseudanabaena mucicola FACHB-723 TaxID=2692860 RepID=A0ABR7ZYF0_9CYAN|nr:photosystem II reaction center protein PsbM [Pseudanabaena mucicola]MBD2188942.1 photosystem II reaction center protein M [Pseudanabaena mucicola FACHB-723]OIP73226.1 MAG: photosystem II reaction center protein PsbM [Oscillatoriales cyanobacterium CG2_30_44_21]PZU97794.1 MAG: Photosystem II reaction center protein M [Pseudanabaena sp.]
MEVNFLGLLATVLAVFVPTVFLLTLYIQTASREEGQANK